MKCPRCQQDNPPHAKFCLECGAPVDGIAPIPKSYADIKDENERLKSSLGETLEQQTATSEILRVISSLPTDVQPVFDAITESAARLCGVADGWIVLTEGDTLRGVSAVGQLVGQLPVYNARRVPPYT
jgi:Double zinc ribbon